MSIQENNLLTETDVVQKLTAQPDLYSPLKIKFAKSPRRVSGYQPDLIIDVKWRDRKKTFFAEVKSRTAPKGILQSLAELRNVAGQTKVKLLLVVPYLSKTVVEMLTREGLSGLDLNGNYLIQADDMLAIRLDQKNRFTESQPIKKIFSGNSSLVGRLLLSTRNRLRSVNEIHSSIKALGGSLSLSAISKVLKGLEEELMIEKSRRAIILIQPEKLLQRLEDDYRPPKVLEVIRLKLPEIPRAAARRVGTLLSPSIGWILSGESSIERYTVTTPPETYTVYATDFAPLSKYQDERFFNIVVKKTLDSFPYFDARNERGLRWSSPIQCYLELSKLDKRERELAADIRNDILKKLK
jgi:hypothetical protein